MLLSEKTWTDVEKYLNESKTIIIPTGSTEQHGPTGLIGTDYQTAYGIAKEVGEKLNVLVTPPLNFGMAEHHLAFPGTISLKPSTYLLFLKDVFSSLIGHGFRKFYIVNGHGGNMAPLTSAFCEVQSDFKEYELSFKLNNWWKTPDVLKYEEEQFKGKSGMHATIGEVSVTQYLHEEAFESKRNCEFLIEKRSFPWPMGAIQFRKNFPDGTMFSDPNLATYKHGEVIFNLAVENCLKEIKNL